MEKFTGKSPKFAGKFPKFAVADRPQWGALFRRLHPAKTAESVAARIGASPRTVENWIDGLSEPSLKWFRLLVCAYGVEALAVALPETLGWLAEARRAEEQRTLEADLRRVQAQLDRLGAKGAR